MHGVGKCSATFLYNKKISKIDGNLAFIALVSNFKRHFINTVPIFFIYDNPRVVCTIFWSFPERGANTTLLLLLYVLYKVWLTHSESKPRTREFHQRDFYISDWLHMRWLYNSMLDFKLMSVAITYSFINYNNTLWSLHLIPFRRGNTSLHKWIQYIDVNLYFLFKLL